MMLAHHDLRVVHVSTHCSLREACDRVQKARVLEVIEIAHKACRDMGIASPRVAVAGLNPHCGENGLFGTEEIEEIKPAIDAARAEGIDAIGPCPPDSVFSEALGGWYDIVVCMYHDQGHIPLKTVGFVYDREAKSWKAVEGVTSRWACPSFEPAWTTACLLYTSRCVSETGPARWAKAVFPRHRSRRKSAVPAGSGPSQ